MLSTVAPSPLPCSTCFGYGSLADDRGPASPRGQDCPDCRGRGYLRCEDCGEPATRTAVGDENIKLCAECGERDDRLCAAGEDHEELRRDAEAFSALTYVGIQHVEASEEGPAYALLMRNCACGSTLCRVIETRKEAA